ncbi:DUF6461 domain-containing protein [Streptomyces sp. CC210A]|uniref:DUF6461 domain-containing protein n=1 Tax=Streptomyces sp. CC210A TaxID=2898184 RepID=UPI001F2F65B6|nr:DUF6461 domain-containing protein [Streptomyces sp. CC210A]
MNSDIAVWEQAMAGPPGFCLTFVQDRTPREVLGAYTPRSTDASLLTLAEARQALRPPYTVSLLRAGQVGSWSFCFEDDLPEGFKPRVLQRLSTGTNVIQVIRGGDGLNTVQRLRCGRQIEFFEPVYRPTLRGDGPHILFGEARDAASRHPERLPLYVTLAVIGQRIGGVVDLALLEGPLLTAFLADSDRESSRPQLSAPLSPKARGLGRLLGPMQT